VKISIESNYSASEDRTHNINSKALTRDCTDHISIKNSTNTENTWRCYLFTDSKLDLLLTNRDCLALATRKHCPQISAVADRSARRSISGPPCYTQMSTVSVINWCPRPSPVYHTDHPTKLTAPETISRSRDMVDAHQI